MAIDKLTFKVKASFHNNKEYQESEIFINGKNLIDILGEYELPYAIREGHENMAGQYIGKTPNELYLSLSGPKNKNSIYVCGCGEEGCWPMNISIVENENTVTWKDFHQPHRGPNSKASYWDYSGFGFFIFSKQEYTAALKELGYRTRFLRIL